MYTQAYCSFVLLNEAITIVSGSHCAHGWHFGFCIRFTGKKIQRVENSTCTSKMAPNSSEPQNNVAHGGLERGKQRVNGDRFIATSLSPFNWW